MGRENVVRGVNARVSVEDQPGRPTVGVWHIHYVTRLANETPRAVSPPGNPAREVAAAGPASFIMPPLVIGPLHRHRSMPSSGAAWSITFTGT